LQIVNLQLSIVNSPDPMTIAVFLPNWIGDVVMATPALRALRQHFDGATMLGVMRPYVADVLQEAPWLDQYLFLDGTGPWSQQWPAVAWQLRRRHAELAVIFPNSFRSALVARLGGCRRRAGYRRYGRGWLLNIALEPVRDVRGRLKPSPIIDAYNRLAEAVGCSWPGYRMELFTSAEDGQAADGVWKKAGLARHAEVVCLNPGAAFGAAKYWDAEYFARLAQDLADLRGSGVLILCGPQERELACRIARLAARPGVHALADLCQETASPKGRNALPSNLPRLSIGLTKACVRRADLLVTTDSGPRHFAAAFDRPVVTLFGPTHIPWTETYYARAVHLQKKVACGPCQLRVCPLDHRCMKELTPAEVFRAAADLLTHTQRKAS
jgi:heptosyltransferase-2